MAHFAKINKKNIVEEVIVADSLEWCEENLGGDWVQTSYNTHGGVHKDGGQPLRKNFAGVGYTYDKKRDAFIPPQPYKDWVLNKKTCCWEAPVPYPSDGEDYWWDEKSNEWIKGNI